jgi:hypothetical protein
MTPESPAILESLLRANDLGWMIDMFTPRDRAVTVLLEQLRKLTAEWRRRFPNEVSFAPETLKSEAERNPHKIRAFLQALGVSNNPDMLLMVWRILQGRSIREVTMNYLEQDRFSLDVTLALPGQSPDECDRYHTEDIKDAALLRHFGITTVDGRPLFEGFFPLRKS